jgi:hypothetical protein
MKTPNRGTYGVTCSALLFVGAACGSSSHATSGDGGVGAPGPDGEARHDGGVHHDGGAGHGDGATGGGDTGVAPGVESGIDAPPVTPTVSSWVGTNADADLPFADITYLMAPFAVSGLSAEAGAAKLDANGYPLAGVSAVSSGDMGFELPTGTYNISYVGTGKLTVSGIGALVSSTWTTSGSEQRNQVKITGTPGNFGNFLTLTITNTGSETVGSVHVYLPGVDYDTKDPFNPEFITALVPFRAMRFMDWMATNKNTLSDWADHPTSSRFGFIPAVGYPYDLIVPLINETGKDGWINVPEHADAAFITQLAQLFASTLDWSGIAQKRKAAGFTTPFQLIVENSNETWNNGFTAYDTFLAAAQMNTARYTGKYTGTTGPTWMSGNSDLMMVAQYEADRLVTIGQTFSTAFKAVGHADAVAPVLSGWALGAAYSDEGLSFIKSAYGPPGSYVTYVALAPYFATPDDTTTGSLSTLFPALLANITSNAMVFPDFAGLRTTYGIQIAAYEGGQGISGDTNLEIKHLAQFDARMNTTYTTYLSSWTSAFGPSLFMHFNLTGTTGEPENIYQFGFWGSLTGVAQDTATCGANLPMLTGTEMVSSVSQYCPKYSALAAHVPK